MRSGRCHGAGNRPVIFSEPQTPPAAPICKTAIAGQSRSYGRFGPARRRLGGRCTDCRTRIIFRAASPSKHLAAYKEISPEIPERIMRMAENQSDHRRQLESAIVASNLKLEVRGQVFGFVIAMSAVIGGIYLMANGQSLEGASTAIAALAGLVGLFFWVRRERKQELKKSKANAPVMTGDSSAPLSPPRSPQ